MTDKTEILPEPAKKKGPGRPRKVRPEDLIVVTDDHQFPTFPTYQLTEILEECAKCGNENATAIFLRDHMSVDLEVILQLIYNPAFKFNLDMSNLPGRNDQNKGFVPLFKAIRKLEFLIKGEKTDRIDEKIRQRVLNTMLDEVKTGDYQSLVKILQKKPFAGITRDTAEKAIGQRF